MQVPLKKSSASGGCLCSGSMVKNCCRGSPAKLRMCMEGADIIERFPDNL